MQLEVNGKQLQFEGSDADLGVIHELYTIPLYPRIAAMCHEGDVVVDIGAHQGGFSLMCAAYGAKVFAVDPQPHNMQMLMSNTVRSGLQNNILGIMEAIGAKDGLADFCASDNAHGFLAPITYKGYVIKVHSQTLASFFNEYHIEHCKVLKCDCEGGEWQIFTDDAIPPLLHTDVVVIEWHSGEPQKLSELLCRCGFFDVRTMYSPVPTLGAVVGIRND